VIETSIDISLIMFIFVSGKAIRGWGIAGLYRGLSIVLWLYRPRGIVSWSGKYLPRRRFAGIPFVPDL
jgi:hypothetical protein